MPTPLPFRRAMEQRRREARHAMGLTQVQHSSLMRIEALKRRFATESSYWTVVEMERVVEECDREIERYFPEDWARIVAERAAAQGVLEC